MDTNKQYNYYNPVCIFWLHHVFIWTCFFCLFLIFVCLGVYVCCMYMWYVCVCHGRVFMPCAYMWRTEKDTKHLPTLSTLLHGDRVSPWTRSSPFWLGWPASKLPSLCHHVSECCGYRYTWPHLAFTWVLGLEFRFSGLSSKCSYPLNHLLGPSTHFFWSLCLVWNINVI